MNQALNDQLLDEGGMPSAAANPQVSFLLDSYNACSIAANAFFASSRTHCFG